MPQLSTQRLHQIDLILDKTLFTSVGYTVNSNGAGDKIVEISLNEKPTCYIRLEAKERTKTISIVQYQSVTEAYLLITEVPGDIYATESSEVANFDDFVKKLAKWTDRTKKEVLFVNVFEEELKEFRKQLNSELDEKFADKAAKFSVIELDAIRVKLAEFHERLSALEVEKVLTQKQASEASSVIDDLERAAQVLPKRAWYSAAATKFFQLSRTAAEKAGQQAIASSVKLLLEGGVHLNHLSKHV